MCGFAAAIDTTGATPDEALVRRMGCTLAHRGPDDSGTWTGAGAALAFRRLSILDLSPAGHQPFVSEDGATAVAFNGEIFNFVELRRELCTLGHRFRSGTDTEVLLRAYLQWGVECLPRLNGMWAFIIVDTRRGLVFGARDRFGVKPMYRARRGPHHYFASEIKAIRALAPGDFGLDWDVASRLLAAGRLDTVALDGATFYQGIHEVPAAHAFTLTRDGVERQWRYWSLPEEQESPEVDPPAAVLDLLHDAVRLRLRSDVPVGVALSGGMDSSTIICLMHELRQQDVNPPALHAFTYAPAEQHLDEQPFIRDTVAYTGASLHTTSMSPQELWATLPAVLAFHDEPLHSPTALVGYQVYGLAAAAGVRVVLGGQGADEVLGGYPSYFPEAWIDGIRQGRMRRTVEEVIDFGRGHGQAPMRLLLQLAYRLLARGVGRGSARRRPPAYASWISRDAAPRDGHDARIDSFRAALATSVERHPLPLFLRIEDRNSMAHSVEARLPFLDYRLVHLAFRLATHWKVRGRWNKYALRSGARGRIPERVRSRVDKMGFPTAFSSWIRGPLRASIEDVLHDPATSELGVFRMAEVRKGFQEHLRGAHDHSLALFHVVQFMSWHRSVASGSVAR